MPRTKSAKRVVLNDIAEAAGVSSATVSRALDPRKSDAVHPDTLARIRRVQEELGFESDRLARKLRRQVTETIALVVTDSLFSHVVVPDFSPHNAMLAFDMIRGVLTEVESWGYDAKILPAEDATAASLLSRLRYPHADGAIIMGLPEMPQLAELVVEQGIPAVAMNSFAMEQQTLPVIAAESRDAYYRAIGDAYQHGHRQIAFITHSEDPLEAGRRGMRGRFLDYRDAMVEYDLWQQDQVYYFGSELELRAWLRDHHHQLPFTAVCCVNDAMAARLVRECEVLGLSIPNDLAVLGYDNNEVHVQQEGLATIAIPRGEIGREAAKTVIQMIQAETSFPGCRVLPALYRQGRTWPGS